MLIVIQKLSHDKICVSACQYDTQTFNMSSKTIATLVYHTTEEMTRDFELDSSLGWVASGVRVVPA